jgi:light-regulated signal transduction histidine kinase (bacteriophytochrome)
LSSVVDITERKRAEQTLREKTEELERSNQDLEQFAYVASHDLREPLRMVATYVTLLEREYGAQLGPQAQEYIRFAVEGAERMARLVSDLLAYARITPRTAPFGPVDLKSLAETVVHSLRATIDEAHAQVKVAELPTVPGDPLQLSQVLQNLLENALKFRSDRKPRLELRAEPRGRDWMLSCHDNGIGIEPRFFTRIFELFQRLHTADRYPGTGMGLALCKKIVERHGGRIWVDSKFSEGTTVYFTLPRIQEAASPGA